MSFIDYFKPVKSISASDAVQHIKESNGGNLCLLDVRQPHEFATGHLPGAKLVPLSELGQKAKQMKCKNDSKIIVYCQSGNRSRVAARILTGMGFQDVLNLDGGILAFR